MEIIRKQDYVIRAGKQNKYSKWQLPFSGSRFKYKPKKGKHETMILAVVQRECGTWSLILKEECWKKVSENALLRVIFGLNRDDVTATGKWRAPCFFYFSVCIALQTSADRRLPFSELVLVTLVRWYLVGIHRGGIGTFQGVYLIYVGEQKERKT